MDPIEPDTEREALLRMRLKHLLQWLRETEEVLSSGRVGRAHNTLKMIIRSLENDG